MDDALGAVWVWSARIISLAGSIYFAFAVFAHNASTASTNAERKKRTFVWRIWLCEEEEGSWLSA